MKILVLSNRHHLLPFADTLSEQNEVTTVVLKDRYESCWDMSLPKALKGKQKSTDTYKKLFGALKEEGGTVITDSRKMTQSAHEAGCPTYGVLNSPPVSSVPNLILLGWFHDEHAHNLALGVPDWGLWPGGMGPFVLAGLTVSRWKSAQLSAALGSTIPVDQMKADSFSGMFAVYLKFDGNGFQRVGYAGGWMPILSHAYLHGLNFDDFPRGPKGLALQKKMHVVTLPVSVPPYPLECNYKAAPVEINPELMRLPGVWLHDVEEAENGLRTAGTDGLVAVVGSSADRLTKARHGALALAAKVQLPQVQWRADVGALAERMFDMLEDYGL